MNDPPDSLTERRACESAINHGLTDGFELEWAEVGRLRGPAAARERSERVMILVDRDLACSRSASTGEHDL
jgi:hypothetical protein